MKVNGYRQPSLEHRVAELEKEQDQLRSDFMRFLQMFEEYIECTKDNKANSKHINIFVHD